MANSEVEDDSWTDKLKEDLETCLRDVKSSGIFPHFEVLKDAPDPRVHIKDIGQIGLPLSEENANAIMSKSNQTASGHGFEATGDTNAQKTWELSPAEFSLTNAMWEADIMREDVKTSVMQKVSKDLEIGEKTIGAELCKLLLCESGARFKLAQNSGKSPGNLGTLVIALPSNRKVGELDVTFSGLSHREQVFQDLEPSEFGYSFLKWDSNATYEDSLNVSRRRLVLIYNLVYTALEIPDSPPNSTERISNLTLLLSRWNSNLNDQRKETPETLGYLFQHGYDKTSLSFDELKGRDQKVASLLREACRQVGFYFYLAHFERTVEGQYKVETYHRYDRYGNRLDYDDDDDDEEDEEEAYHHIVEVSERHMFLNSIVDLDGTTVSDGICYDEDEDIIQEDPFDGRELDDDDYDNQRGAATHYYRGAVGLIMPPKSRIPFFLQHRSLSEVPEINLWIDRNIKAMAMNPNSDVSQKAREEVEEICMMVIADTRSWKAGQVQEFGMPTEPYSAVIRERVFVAAIELNDYALCMEAFKVCSGILSVPRYHHLGVMMRRYSTNDQLRKLASSELQHLQSFAQRYEALSNLFQGAQEKLIEDNRRLPPAVSVAEFFANELKLAMNSMALTSIEDGIALVRRAESLRTLSLHELFDTILPYVKRNVEAVSMVAAFLTEMMNAASGGKIPESSANSAFTHLIKDLAKHVTLSTIDLGNNSLSNKRLQTTYGTALRIHNYASHDQESPETIVARKTASNIAHVLRHCLLLDLKTELSQLLTRLISETRILHVDAFHALLLPLLKRLKELSKEEDMIPFHEIFQVVLSEYVVRYVQSEPQPPTDWTRSEKGCGCFTCQDLDKFTVDPTAEVGRFSAVEERRKHLTERMGGEYRLTTDKSQAREGRPYTLVATKTLRGHEREKKAWKMRFEQGMQRIHDLGPESLMRTLLGNVFDSIWSLDAKGLAAYGPDLRMSTSTEPPAGTLPLETNASHTNRVPQPLSPITNRKRPAMIDLTRDLD